MNYSVSLPLLQNVVNALNERAEGFSNPKGKRVISYRRNSNDDHPIAIEEGMYNIPVQAMKEKSNRITRLFLERAVALRNTYVPVYNATHNSETAVDEEDAENIHTPIKDDREVSIYVVVQQYLPYSCFALKRCPVVVLRSILQECGIVAILANMLLQYLPKEHIVEKTIEEFLIYCLSIPSISVQRIFLSLSVGSASAILRYIPAKTFTELLYNEHRKAYGDSVQNTTNANIVTAKQNVAYVRGITALNVRSVSQKNTADMKNNTVAVHKGTIQSNTIRRANILSVNNTLIALWELPYIVKHVYGEYKVHFSDMLPIFLGITSPKLMPLEDLSLTGEALDAKALYYCLLIEYTIKKSVAYDDTMHVEKENHKALYSIFMQCTNVTDINSIGLLARISLYLHSYIKQSPMEMAIALGKENSTILHTIAHNSTLCATLLRKCSNGYSLQALVLWAHWIQYFRYTGMHVYTRLYALASVVVSRLGTNIATVEHLFMDTRVRKGIYKQTNKEFGEILELVQNSKNNKGLSVLIQRVLV